MKNTQIDGDSGFIGVVSRMSPDQLPAGVVQHARNCRFTDGSVSTRRGIIPLAHLNSVERNSLLFDNHKTHRGHGTFKDPDDFRNDVFVAEGKVWYSRAGSVPVQVKTPSNLYIEDDCSIVQAFDRILIFRGDRNRPLICSDLDDGFDFIIPDYDSTSTYSEGDLVAWGDSIPSSQIAGCDLSSDVNPFGPSYGPVAFKYHLDEGIGVGVDASQYAREKVLYGWGGADHGFKTGDEVQIEVSGQAGWTPRRVYLVDTKAPFVVDVVPSSPLEPSDPPTAVTFHPIPQALNIGDILYFAYDYAGTIPAGYGKYAEFEVTANASVGATSVTGQVNQGALRVGMVSYASNQRTYGFKFWANDYTGSDITSGVLSIPEGHSFRAGDTLVLSGWATATNGTYTVAAPITGTSVTLSGYAGADDSGGGTVSDAVTITSPVSATVRRYNRVFKAKEAIGVGEDPTSASTKWKEVFTTMPPCKKAVYMMNRVVATTAYDQGSDSLTEKRRDYIVSSDILDPTSTFYNQSMRINEGDNDEIVDIVGYTANQIVVFKNTSVHLITAATADLTNVVRQTLIPNYGSAGEDQAVVVGDDIVFWSGNRGLVSIKRSSEGILHGVDLPLTHEIQDVVDRIDYENTSLIKVAYHNNRIYVAVPMITNVETVTSNGIIEKRRANNAVLVYDYLNGKWAGYDDGDGLSVKRWIKYWVNDEQRLGFISEAGGAYEYEGSFGEDLVIDTDEDNNIRRDQIETEVTTREYHGKGVPFKIYQVGIGIDTYDPAYTVKLSPNGPYEDVTVVSGRTKDRTKYNRPFDAADYDATNDSYDYETPYREDYSVVVDPTGFSSRSIADGTPSEAGNVYTDRMQEFDEMFKPRPREGSGIAVNIVNTNGAISLNRCFCYGQLRENRHPQRT